MDLATFVGKLLSEQDGDVVREGRKRPLAQASMEAEVTAVIGAEPSERRGEWLAYRNRSREQTCDTCVSTITLAIPKITPGSYFPSLLEPRRRAERALCSRWCRRLRSTPSPSPKVSGRVSRQAE